MITIDDDVKWTQHTGAGLNYLTCANATPANVYNAASITTTT